MKKIMQKLLAVTLCAALFFSTNVTANAKGFSDVTSTTECLDAINYVSDNGIMDGTTPTKFAPENAVTRGMMVTILYRKAGSPSVTIGTTFTDVPSTAYYAKAVYWAAKNGITNGTSATTFSPDRIITRQQAMCFLYNYSKIANTAVNKTVSITGYSDYSNVSAYAREAMAWAVGNKISSYFFETGQLLPTYNMSRKLAAEAITAFGTNVERIVVGSDNLGIVNSKSYFTNEKYYLTQTHYEKLKSAYERWGGTNGSAELLDKLKKEWSGSCYGLSSVVILDKYGKIGFNENYSSPNKTMYDVKSIKAKKAESAINYYHKAYSIIGSGSGRENIRRDIRLTMSICMNASGPSMLSYYWKGVNSEGKTVTHGHTILVNSCSFDGSVYTLNVCNPNTIAKGVATLTTDGKLAILGNTYDLTEIEAKNDFDDLMYTLMDIDGYQNSDTSSSSAAVYKSDSLFDKKEKTVSNGRFSTALLQKNFSTLSINLVGEFTVINDYGQSLTWTGESFIGDMKIYNLRLIPNGENHVSCAEIDVPESKMFAFKSSVKSDDVWFSVTDSYRYARVSGWNVGDVTIEEGGLMTLSGDFLKFDVAYCNAEENPLLFTTSGEGKELVNINCNGDQLNMVGTDRAYTVESTDLNRNSIRTVQIIPDSIE